MAPESNRDNSLIPQSGYQFGLAWLLLISRDEVLLFMLSNLVKKEIESCC